jgi:hypothetical protein
MKIQFYTGRAPSCKWHVVPRHQYFTEAIANLEFTQWTVVLVAVVEQPIGNMGHAFCSAEFNRLGQHGIGWPFVVVAALWNQIKYGSNLAPINNL